MGQGVPIDLQLRDPGAGSDPRRDAQVWVSGPTRIDLLETSANWTMDWTVDAGRRGAASVRAGARPGPRAGGRDRLRGRRVPGRSARRNDAGHGAAGRATPRQPSYRSVRSRGFPARASGRSPPRGRTGALWTGGTTSVRLDASRTLEECRERAGRRVAPPAGEPNDPRLLVFEARASRCRSPSWSSASRRPRSRARSGAGSCWAARRRGWSARSPGGSIVAACSASRSTCRPPGSPIGSGSPAWTSRSTGIPRSCPTARSAFTWFRPASAPDRGTPILTVEATATVAGGRGPLALPRVRPVGVRIADELWVAWTDPSLSLRPTSAQGLAWIDPRIATATGTSTAAADAGTRTVCGVPWPGAGSPRPPGRGTRRSRAGRDRAERHRRPARGRRSHAGALRVADRRPGRVKTRSRRSPSARTRRGRTPEPGTSRTRRAASSCPSARSIPPRQCRARLARRRDGRGSSSSPIPGAVA